MRETRNAPASIFDFYTEHELGQQLKQLSELLDEYPQILAWVAQDFDKANVAGTCGLSIESIFRCLLLKQITGLSYKKLAFHLSDYPSYRAFVRLKPRQFPSKSSLQATVSERALVIRESTGKHVVTR